jgi:hypothetical protein
MQREAIWLAVVGYVLAGVVFVYVILHKGRLEYDPEIVVSVVATLGFGMVGLIFLGLLNR